MICPHCKKPINIKELKMRSLPQNASYWGITVDILSSELGYSPNETHEILKQKFLTHPIYIKLKDRVEEVYITKSTASLTTVEFEEYMSNIRMWASSELGIFIPEPWEQMYD